MSFKIIVLDFKLSNTLEEYLSHMKSLEQHAIIKEMGVKTYIWEISRGSKKSNRNVSRTQKCFV